MDSPEGRRIHAALVRRCGRDGSAPVVAAAAVAVWREIAQALSPIIGARGVTALYGRALFLAGRVHPWLGSATDGLTIELDLDNLRTRIGARTDPGVLEGSAEFLLTFHDLLNSMVGPALAERMLGPVWDRPADGESAPDIQS
jgi:hypothetical protein